MQAATPPAARGAASDGSWSIAKRAWFRFVALYFVVYFSPAPLTSLFRSPEQMDWYTGRSARLWDPIVNAVGHVLGIRGPLSVIPRPSNDGLADYVQLVCFLLIAVACAVLWSILDRAQPHVRVHAFLRVWLRYVLAAMLLAYGFAKVFPQQMPLPEPAVLLTPYGRSAPMTLLWTFMGASPAYEIFGGIAEVAGGLLLLRRRTTPLGALVAAAVMTNVVMLNLCYGVYLKQLAIHLLLLALFLLTPSVPRLFDALALGRAVPRMNMEEPFASSSRAGLLGAKALVAGCILYSQAAPCVHHYFVDDDGAPLPDLYGIYDVEEMRRGDTVVAPLLTDPTCWRHVYFGRRGSGVYFADGSRLAFALSRGAARETWSLTRDRAALSLVRAAGGRIVIEGTLDGQTVVVHARPTDEKNLRLVRSRFHWVTEL